MFYKAVFSQKNTSQYYKDDELLFKTITKVSFSNLSSITSIYDKDVLIFSFSETVFTILFWRLKILTQKLDKKIHIEKIKLRYTLLVDNKRISLRFTKNPFSYKIGKVYLNENCVGEINKTYSKSNTSFNFTFYEETGVEYYFLILFSMSSIGITGDD
jgi:hypothetical protein